MLPVLRLLRFWLLIAAGLSSLGLMVMALPLATLLLDGAALPAGHDDNSLRWLLATALPWLLWLGTRQWHSARNEALRQAIAARRPLNVDALKQGHQQMLQREKHQMLEGSLLGAIGAGLLMLLYLLGKLL